MQDPQEDYNHPGLLKHETFVKKKVEMHHQVMHGKARYWRTPKQYKLDRLHPGTPETLETIEIQHIERHRKLQVANKVLCWRMMSSQTFGQNVHLQHTQNKETGKRTPPTKQACILYSGFHLPDLNQGSTSF